jgi:hypothetical protein
MLFIQQFWNPYILTTQELLTLKCLN